LGKLLDTLAPEVRLVARMLHFSLAALCVLGGVSCSNVDLAFEDEIRRAG